MLKIKIESFSHATEDLDKVIQAIKNLVNIPNLSFNITKLKGHWGNVIYHISTILENSDSMNFVKRIAENLKEEEKILLNQRINLHVNEEGWLYLRFDKQKSFNNEIKMVFHDDSIRVILIPKEKNINVKEFYRKLNIIK